MAASGSEVYAVLKSISLVQRELLRLVVLVVKMDTERWRVAAEAGKLNFSSLTWNILMEGVHDSIGESVKTISQIETHLKVLKVLLSSLQKKNNNMAAGDTNFA